MKRAFIVMLLAIICVGSAASADVPTLLNYQGVLTDASGVAVPDGPYSITFRIYDVSSGGSALWEETDVVQTARGTFSATLGSVNPLSSLPFDEPYYLSISIGGGSELPREALAASPYSLCARAVVGSENVFPSEGSVGVGTASPQGPFHVKTGNIHGIRLDGMAANSQSLVRINAAGANSNPGVELCMQGVTKSLMYVGSGGDWHLEMGGTDGLVVSGSTRNVGLGVAAPAEKLDVAGGVRLGTTTGASAGTLRWSGSDFEGYDGSVWKSLTATGGSLPSGASGQTLRHDGSSWVATSSLYNSGTAVGIGTTTPTAMLHVAGGVNIGTATADGSLSISGSGGDASVALPAGAISAAEILDEPGFATNATTSNAVLTESFAAYCSQTIVAPAGGYVQVTATTDASVNHTNGAETTIIFGVSNDPGSLPATQNSWLDLPAAMPTGVYHFPVTVSGTFQVAAGSNTFHFVARALSGAGTLWERQLTLLYAPTAHGVFVAPFAAANGERMQQELDAVKARLAKLEAEMKGISR